MKKVIFSLFALALQSLAALAAPAKFQEVYNLTKKIDYNGSVAVVIPSDEKMEEGRVAALIYNPKTGFKEIAIKSENLQPLTHKVNPTRALQEILDETVMRSTSASVYIASRFKSQNLTEAQCTELNEIHAHLLKIGNEESFLDSGNNERKAQMIGHYISSKFGFKAMQYVADKNRIYRPYISRAWNRIGDWMDSSCRHSSEKALSRRGEI